MSDPRDYLTLEQVQRLLTFCKSDRDYLIIRLLFATGCRVGELTRIIVKDLNAEDGLILIPTEKRRKSKERVDPRDVLRPVYVDKETMLRLVSYIKKEGLKSEARIIPLTIYRVYQIIRDTGKKSGIPKLGDRPIHPHAFRHGHALFWINRRGDVDSLRKLQIQLGHTSFSTTAAYLNYSREEIKKTHEEIWGDVRW